MAARDRISDQNLRAIFASVEAETLKPPDSLTGAAREMFTLIAEHNVSRPWGPSHADALAQFCRVSVMWEQHLAAVEKDGALVEGGKLNPNFKALRALGGERTRLARILGLGNSRDRLLGGNDLTGQRGRELGTALARAREDDDSGLLA